VKFTDLVRTRRMTRAFLPDPIGDEVLHSLIDLALRAPSAGKTQGTHFVVLAGHDVAEFWNDTLPVSKREIFRWRQLLDAPVIILPFVDPLAYVERYAEPDKVATGLGEGIHAWPTPYWTVDGSFAVMTLLLAAHDVGLGALFFAVFNGEQQLRNRLGVPEHMQLLGAVAIGNAVRSSEKGRSAARPRVPIETALHQSRW
jgi:nitroreductase